jgi:hypothetical protein
MGTFLVEFLRVVSRRGRAAQPGPHQVRVVDKLGLPAIAARLNAARPLPPSSTSAKTASTTPTLTSPNPYGIWTTPPKISTHLMAISHAGRDTASFDP